MNAEDVVGCVQALLELNSMIAPRAHLELRLKGFALEVCLHSVLSPDLWQPVLQFLAILQSNLDASLTKSARRFLPENNVVQAQYLPLLQDTHVDCSQQPALPK